MRIGSNFFRESSQNDKNFKKLPEPLQALLTHAVKIKCGIQGLSVKPVSDGTNERLCFAFLTWMNCSKSTIDTSHGAHRRWDDFSAQDWFIVKEKMLSKEDCPFRRTLPDAFQTVLLAAVAYCARLQPYAKAQIAIVVPMRAVWQEPKVKRAWAAPAAPETGTPDSEAVDEGELLSVRGRFAALQVEFEKQKEELAKRPTQQQWEQSRLREAKLQEVQITLLKEIRMLRTMKDLSQPSTTTLTDISEMRLRQELSNARARILRLEQELQLHRTLQ